MRPQSYLTIWVWIWFVCYISTQIIKESRILDWIGSNSNWTMWIETQTVRYAQNSDSPRSEFGSHKVTQILSLDLYCSIYFDTNIKGVSCILLQTVFVWILIRWWEFKLKNLNYRRNPDPMTIRAITTNERISKWWSIDHIISTEITFW